jgi:hypothetical protein
MGGVLGTWLRNPHRLYKNAMTDGPMPFPLVDGRCPLCGQEPTLGYGSTMDWGHPHCKRCLLYWWT